MERSARGFLWLAPAILAAAALLLPSSPAAAGKKSKEEVPSSPEMISTPQKFFQEGLHYYQAGQLDLAQSSLEAAIKEDPRLTEAYYMLGMVAFNRGEFAKAEGYFQESLKQNTFFTDAHNVLGLVYQEMGQPDKALQEWQIVLTDRNYPTPEVAAFNMGKVYLERGAYEQAATFFRRAASTAPEWGRAWFALGFVQEQMKALDDARFSYERAIRESEPNSTTLYKIQYRYGLVCFKQENSACAHDAFEQVLQLRPGTPEADQARELLKALDKPNPFRGLAR